MTKAFSKTELTNRYSKALYATARDKKSLDTVLDDVQNFMKMMDISSDLQAVIKNPSISINDKFFAFSEIAKKANFSETFSNFIKIVTENNRLFFIYDILKSYLNEVDKEAGIETVIVKTISPIRDEEKIFMEKSIGSVLNKKIKIDARIDKSLLGGIQIALGSRMIDSTYKTKLNQVKLLMVKD